MADADNLTEQPAPFVYRSEQAATRPRALARWIALALLVLGLAGVALRFDGLSTRVFWADEVVTAVRLSGYTFAEVFNRVYDGRVHTVADIRPYLQANPQRGISGVARSLAIEDAQHPPLYYAVVYGFARAFGSTPAMLRVPGAIFGALVPFALAWLCWELFGSLLSALIGFALSALSPVLVIYSQQAREYGLWALLTVVATALLVRASEKGASIWLLYAAAAAAGLYADFIFILVLLGHCMYAGVLLRGRRLGEFAASLTAAGVAFVPWAIVIKNGMGRINADNVWSTQTWPLKMILEKWIFNAGATFFDLEYAHAAYAIVMLPVLLFAAYAVYRVMKSGSEEQRLVLAALVIPSVIFVAIPDLVLHEHRSTVTRYGMPIYIALIVAVAGLLAQRLASRARLAWAAATLALALVGLWSVIVDVRSSVWWDNHENAGDVRIAQIVNAKPGSVTVVHKKQGKLLELAVYLHDTVRILPIPNSDPITPPRGFSPVYLYGLEPDAEAYRRFIGARRVRPVYLARETNAQLGRFRSGAPRDGATDLTSLWALGPAH